MKQSYVFLILLATAVAGCSDGVPAVADPHNVVVDGQPMTQKDFLLKYCAGKVDNETCAAVGNAMAKDSTKSKTIPRF